jgi:hypothetical protein
VSVAHEASGPLEGGRAGLPSVEVVLPCLDEVAILAGSVEALASHLQASFPGAGKAATLAR